MQKKKDSDALKEANEKLKETTTLHKKKKRCVGRRTFLLSPVKEKSKFVRMAACAQEVNRNLFLRKMLLLDWTHGNICSLLGPPFQNLHFIFESRKSKFSKKQENRKHCSLLDLSVCIPANHIRVTHFLLIQ